jgi:hypothetical protein
LSDNLKLLKNLFQELEKPLFLGDGLTTGEFHVLMQPGQFVSTNLTQAGNSDDMAIQAALTNDLIDTQFVYTKLLGTLSNQYLDIINNVALPHQSITQSQQDTLDDDMQWLAKNDAAYTMFANYYYDAIDAYDAEVNSQTPDSGKIQKLYMKLTQASNKWATFGQKDEYERRQGEIQYIESGDPVLMWKRFRDLVNFHSKNASNLGAYMQNFLIPPVSQWMNKATSWGTFEKIINEQDTYSYSKSTSWGAGGSVGWGLFSVGGSASGSSTYNHSESDVTAVDIKFDYLRVRISRPWLTEDIFGYSFWWWKKVFGYRLLSDGGNLLASPPIRPIGIMPFIPEYAIVAKSVSITANFTHNDQTTITHQLSAGVSGGWGPFSVSGSYNESDKTVQTHASFDGTTILIDQPQIIAFTGTLMPRTPNPDRTLPWQGDQAPFDPPAASILAPMRAARRADFEALRPKS